MSKTKSGSQGNRITGKIYQSVCSCEWKSAKSAIRSSVRYEAEQHQRLADNSASSPKHITQMRRVEA